MHSTKEIHISPREAPQQDAGTSTTVTRESNSKLISVLAADGCPLLLRGIASVLETERDIHLVAQAEDGDEALRLIEELSPDVAVVSLHTPGKGGLEMLEALQGVKSNTRPVILADHLADEEFIRAMQLGVRGILLQSMPTIQLARCVRMVHAGEEFVEKATFLRAFGKLLRNVTAHKELSGVLTAREHAVMQLAVSGLNNKDVARKLAITEGTVKVHLHRAYAKLGVSGRLGLFRYAREHGLV